MPVHGRDEAGCDGDDRPEDVEYNFNDLSGTPRIYVAFTNHTRQVALNQSGVLYDPSTHATDSPNRGDNTGSVMAIQEANPTNPGSSATFTFFTAWRGSLGQGPYDAAAPDNIALDSNGGVCSARTATSAATEPRTPCTTSTWTRPTRPVSPAS